MSTALESNRVLEGVERGRANDVQVPNKKLRLCIKVPSLTNYIFQTVIDKLAVWSYPHDLKRRSLSYPSPMIKLIADLPSLYQISYFLSA